MKKTLLILALAISGSALMAQENIVTLNGGYVFVTGQEVNADLSGWRINGVYEFNPMGGPISHGLAFGYANASGPSTVPNQSLVNITIGTWPVYYQPKLRFGEGKVQGFISGALGWQFSKLTREAAITITDNNGGFYGGGGAGFMFNISETLFIQATYEIAYMSNYNYNDGWLNSAMGGIGFRF